MGILRNDYSKAMKDFRKGETNTYIEFKRTMGTDAKYPCSNLNRNLTSEELSAEVLKKLKSFVLDENISSVVITVPTKFTVPQNEATIRAAKMAGFKQVRLLQEPIAAVTAYSLSAENKDGYWLVFDFGGGTFDAALIKVEEGVMQIKDTEGDNFLGGKNLDEAIIDQIILPYLRETYSIDSILNDPDKREILRKGVKHLAEKAKNDTSFADTTTLLTNLGDIPFEDEFGIEIDIEIPLTLKDMERVFSPIFQKAIDITKELLRRNNLNKDKLDSLILVGKSTLSPILRRMLKEQITENMDTSIDPETVISQGAALFASTVDIEINDGDPPSDSNKIVLDLKYPAQTVETSEMLSIKVQKDKSGKLSDEIFVELKRADGSWSVMQQVNDKKATIFNVELMPEKSNFFEIYITDSEANLLKCEQEGFTILQGIINPPTPLPYHIGIAKYFEDKEKDLFYPIKGLEKNREIPATGMINGLKTHSIIEKGNANHKFQIPIYQGDYGSVGTELSLNHLIYEVIITGKNLPHTLPESSIVDITIKVDESQRMYFNAYFPDLDYSEEMEIEIQQEKVPSVKELAGSITKAKRRAQMADRNDLVRKLDDLDEQLKRGAGSEDNKLGIQKNLDDIRIQLPIEIWEDVKKELNKAYNELKKQINELGEHDIDKDYKASYNDIKRKKRQVIAKKNIREAKKMIEDINVLKFKTDPEKFVKMLLACHFQFDTIKWINAQLARQLIDRGSSLLNRGLKNEIPPIIEQLFQLIDRITEPWPDPLKEMLA